MLKTGAPVGTHSLTHLCRLALSHMLALGPPFAATAREYCWSRVQPGRGLGPATGRLSTMPYQDIARQATHLEHEVGDHLQGQQAHSAPQ